MCCGAKSVIYQQIEGAYVPQVGDYISCRVLNHSGPLSIGEVNYGHVRPGVIIRVHHQLVEQSQDIVTPIGPARSAKVDAGPMGRYAFWPESRFGHLKTGTRVEAWRFYFLPVAIAESARFPFEAVRSDKSRVGRRLKNWFASIGAVAKPGCSCKRLAMMLDEANLEFIERHHEKIVDRIVDSAKAMDKIAPRLIVSRMLTASVWFERRSLRRQESNAANSPR